jgi:hypothetical protein
MRSTRPAPIPVPVRRPEPAERSVVAQPIADVAAAGAVSDVATPLLDGVETELLGGPEAEPETSFVDETKRGKAQMLAELMHENEDLLTANGMANRDHILGGIMMNEGARNQQVLQLGANRTFREAALADLTRDDPEATPSSREISERAREIGVERRTADYGRMSELAARGDAVTAEERAELTRLQGTRLSEFGGATMGELRGMSGDRFRELYDPNAQQRFEAHHYRDFRSRVETYNSTTAEMTPEDAEASRAGRATTRAGMDVHELMSANPQLAEGNFDLLADLSSSFGINQILGSNAYSGQLAANETDGTERTVSLAELKESRNRLDPTRDDLFHHVAFWQGLHGHAPSTDYGQVALDFNGAGTTPRARELRAEYRRDLSANVPVYQRAARDVDG